jgi:hypothetical protein
MRSSTRSHAYDIKKKKKIVNLTGGEDGAGFAPSFIEKPRIIPNEDGTLILLRCKCTANPKPVVTWYKGNKAVVETSKVKMKVTEQENNYEMVLELQVIDFYGASERKRKLLVLTYRSFECCFRIL